MEMDSPTAWKGICIKCEFVKYWLMAIEKSVIEYNN